MKKILIVFGSSSDEHVYNDIAATLRDQDVHYEVRVCSAHRTPDELMVLLANNYDIVIAGAGLAAHLPGVVASKIIEPIIGVPVKSNYEGLDSFLAISQMPPGVPVMSVGVDCGVEAGKMALLMAKEHKEVNLVFTEKTPVVEKAIKTLESFGVPYKENQEQTGELNIKFLTLDEPSTGEDLTIYVPLLDKKDYTAQASLNLLKNSTHGLWVGLNRGENAAIAATQILGGAFKEKLREHRAQQKQKVIESDKQVKQ